MQYKLKNRTGLRKIQNTLRKWRGHYRLIFANCYLPFIFLENPSTDEIYKINSHYIKACQEWSRKRDRTLKDKISKEIAREVHVGNIEITDEAITSYLDKGVSTLLERYKRRAREKKVRIALKYARYGIREFPRSDITMVRNLEHFNIDPDKETITIFYIPTLKRGLPRDLKERVVGIVEELIGYEVRFEVTQRIKRSREKGWSGLTRWRARVGERYQVS